MKKEKLIYNRLQPLQWPPRWPWWWNLWCDHYDDHDNDDHKNYDVLQQKLVT